MKQKISYLSAVMIFFTNCCIGQVKKMISDSANFNKYVADHSASFIFNGTKPSGDGWIMLEKLFAGNQFVAWGEYHNSLLLSQLSEYALEAASGYGFKNWCVEVSPFAAAELTRIAGTGNPLDTIIALSKDHPDYGTFPFFKTKEDVRMLTTAVKYRYHIWGVDQEFQMAFPYCITKAYNAQSPGIKKTYKTVYDSLLAKWWMPDAGLLDSLKKVVVQQKYKLALEDVKISRAIYYESNNLKRAALMKKNFYRYYNAVIGKNEKVFFKMGANHLAKGINLTTRLYDIGNAAYELAQRNETGFANVYFINRYYVEDGKIVDDLESADREYPIEFLKLYNKEKWVVLDLTRFRNRGDKTLSEDAYGIIEKYDFIVVSPEVKK